MIKDELQTDNAPENWVYLRVYLGEAIDRMDWFLTQIYPKLEAHQDVRQWFYIRYMDEGGIHIRLRALSAPGNAELLRPKLVDMVGSILAKISTQPPGTYVPMVSVPGMAEQLEAMSPAHNDLRIIETEYEPEYDKFGGVTGMPIAEALFHVSSQIACEILTQEAAGTKSRKGYLPLAMTACHESLKPDTVPQSFWREYAYYWLGSRTPAAEDWRDKFRRKAEELIEKGISPLDTDALVDDPILTRWRTALELATQKYADLEEKTDMNPEVVTFTIAHLMNNRLGIAPLEESYLATLIETAMTPKAQVA